MAEATGVVRATRVEVVDGEGRVRAVLGTLHADDDDEVVGLVLRDRSGRDRAWLVVMSDGAAEVAVEHAGNVVASVTASADGLGRVAVFDGRGVVVEAMPA